MKNILLENDRPLPYPVGAAPVPGQIYLANESRLAEATFNQPLTTYATGWMANQAKLVELLDFLAPKVPVAKHGFFQFKKAKNNEEYLSETDDDVRTIGADFKRVQYRGETVTEKTLNKGLAIVLDRDAMVGPEEENAAAERLTRRLLRNEVRRAYGLLAAIVGSPTAKTWGATATPDDDVDAALDAARIASGLMPNRVVFGRAAWLARRKSYRAQDKAGAFAASTTPEELAAALSVERIVVPTEVYQSSKTAKTDIVGLAVIGFYGQDNPGKEDASTLKRFVTGVEGGGDIRVYRRELGPKLIEVTVEHYSNIVATSTVGVAHLAITAG